MKIKLIQIDQIMEKRFFTFVVFLFFFLGNLFSQCTINLGTDFGLCPGQTHTFNLPVGNTYLWDNLSVNPNRTVNSAGTYFVSSTNLGANLIVNGDFEMGNTNFTTQYSVGLGGVWGLLSNEGEYAIVSSPNLAHNNFSFCNDHTAAPGVNQLVVNGSGVPGTNVWCQNVNVTPNTNYQFGAWASNALNDPNVAILQFNINNLQVGANFNTSTIGCNWQQFFTTWNSGLNNTANICITNQNNTVGGNDFSLDDITFRPVCIDRDTITVSALPVPIVNLGADQAICETNSINLDAANLGSNFLWNTGSNTQQLTVNTSGNYSVSVTNSAGCSSSDNVNISVELIKNAGNDSLSVNCATQNVVDLNTILSTGTDVGGTWTVGSLPLPNLTNSLVNLNGLDGTYTINYIVNGINCPSDTSLQTLIVNSQPIAANNFSQSLCSTGLNFDLSPFLNHPNNPNGGAWSFPVSFPANGLNLNEIVPTLIPSGNYVLEFILASDSMCVEAVSMLDLRIIATPEVVFVPSIQNGCQPVEVNFVNQSVTAGSSVFEWNFGDGTTSTSSSNQAHTYPNAGVYTVSLTVVTENLCSSTYNLPQPIEVFPLPIASFDVNPQQVFSIDPTINLVNTSSPHQFRNWYLSDGFSSTSENVSHQLPLGIGGNYLIELIITTSEGCSDSTLKIVVVKDQLLVYVPNCFTPDGDEFNNTFFPVISAGVNEDNFSFLIFNRWGELIFESKNMRIGWDGTYMNKLVENGTYTWLLEYSLEENDGREKLSGHFSLLR